MGAGEGVNFEQLLDDFRQGDRVAAGKLVEQLYPQLRRMALVRMVREKGGHTWQPTALVNELYMELARVGPLRKPDGQSGCERQAFLGFVSHLMGRLLIRHSRRIYRKSEKVPLDQAMFEEPAPFSEEFLDVDRALGKLESVNPRLRSVVEMRVFEGLNGDQMAERLGCTRRTVIRDWNFAKQFLAEELAPAPAK